MWYLIVSIPDLCTLTYFALVGNVLNVLVPRRVVSDCDPKVAADFCLQYYVDAACTQIVVSSSSLELYVGQCICRG